jgi:hypothetical protein
MRPALLKSARAFMAAVLVMVVAVPRPLLAQNAPHVVSPSDLAKATVDASNSRQRNIDALNRFLGSDQARQAMQSAHVDQQQVTKAVAGLSDEELAQLAARADKAQSEFAAGNMSDRDLIVIVLLIVALILIIVAVR